MKRQTCADIILEMRNKVPDYPILMRQRGTQKEIMAVTDQKDGWDVYIYQSHGYIFTRVASGLSSEDIVRLEELLTAGGDVDWLK